MSAFPILLITWKYIFSVTIKAICYIDKFTVVSRNMINDIDLSLSTKAYNINKDVSLNYHLFLMNHV